MRIGLLGGSFDPPHQAHRALAEVALAQLQLDELRWVPAGRPWQKTRELAPVDDRAAMVALAIAGEPRFVLDRCELDREGASYTVDTLRTMQAARPGHDWFLVIGQDQYARLDTWRDWAEICERVTLAVAARDGDAVRPSEALAAVSHRIEVLRLPAMPVSATHIRERLARGERAAALVPALVSPEIARYIDQHGLYRAPATPRS